MTANWPHSGAPDRRPLAGQIVGISISDSEDLTRRGFLQIHIDRAMAEIATQLAAAGARLGYGGDLRAEGFTYKLFRTIAELYGTRRIATEAPPFIHYLAYPIWKRWEAPVLLNHVRALAGIGEVVLIRPEGTGLSLRLRDDMTEAPGPVFQIALRSAGTQERRADAQGALYQAIERWWTQLSLSFEPLLAPPMDVQLPSQPVALGQMEKALPIVLESWQSDPGAPDATAFSAMRLFMATDEDARVVLGGQTSGTKGHFPGIAEEALYSLTAGKPVIALRAFGGCAEGVAESLLRAEPAVRDGTDPGYAPVMRALARGAPAYKAALADAGLADDYPRVAGLDSARPLSIGVLKCLEKASLREGWRGLSQEFRATAFEAP